MLSRLSNGIGFTSSKNDIDTSTTISSSVLTKKPTQGGQTSSQRNASAGGSSMPAAMGGRKSLHSSSSSSAGKSSVGSSSSSSGGIFSRFLKSNKTRSSDSKSATAMNEKKTVNNGLGGDDLDALRRSLRLCKEVLTFNGHSEAINDIAICPSGEALYTASDDGTVRKWDVKTAECILVFSHSAPVKFVSVDVDQKSIYSVTHHKANKENEEKSLPVVSVTLRQFDAKSGTMLQSTAHHELRRSPVAISPCGRYLYTVVHKYGERFDLQAHNNCIGKYPPMGRGGVENILVSQCGNFVITAENIDGQGVAKRYEAESTRCLNTYGGHEGKIHGIALSSDGRYLYTCGEDGTAKGYESGIEGASNGEVGNDYHCAREFI